MPPLVTVAPISSASYEPTPVSQLNVVATAVVAPESGREEIDAAARGIPTALRRDDGGRHDIQLTHRGWLVGGRRNRCQSDERWHVRLDINT